MFFFNDTQPVDTVLYYLSAYPIYDLQGEFAIDGQEGAEIPSQLMKKTNNDNPTVFSNFVTDISFTQISASVIEVSVTTQASKPDENYANNFGFRTFQSDEQVFLRNI